jgi:hypothetical protein
LRKASGKEEERKRGREEWENKKGKKRRNNVSKINKCKNKKGKRKEAESTFFFPDVAGKRKIKHVLGSAPCFQREPIIS